MKLDGELSEVERLLLRRHLARCEGCQSFAAAIADTTEAIRATPQVAPSRSAAAEPRRERRRAPVRLAAATALAVVAAGIGVAIGVLVGGGGGSSPTAPEITEIVDLVPPDGQPARTEPVTTVNV